MIVPVSLGKAATYQGYKWHAETLSVWTGVTPGGTVLFERVSSSRARFQPYLAYSIWIDAPQPVRLARGLARDGEAALAQWQVWQAQEPNYLARDAPYCRANIVQNGTLPVGT